MSSPDGAQRQMRGQVIDKEKIEEMFESTEKDEDLEAGSDLPENVHHERSRTPRCTVSWSVQRRRVPGAGTDLRKTVLLEIRTPMHAPVRRALELEPEGQDGYLQREQEPEG